MDHKRPLLWEGWWVEVGEGEMRSCDRRRRTRDSVLTPTVSRKLTGLRSRMMALGRDGSRSGAISMTATSRCSSISATPSCAGGQIANVVRRGNSENFYEDNTLSIMNKNQVYDGKGGKVIGLDKIIWINNFPSQRSYK